MWPDLAQHDDPVGVALEDAAKQVRNLLDGAAVGRLAEPEDDGASMLDQREAELRRNGRLGERLREHDTEALHRLRLGSAPDDLDVR